MQQVVPFKLGGLNPVRVRIGVGDENYRMKVLTATSAPLGIDASLCGWFGRELTKAEADASMAAGGGTDPDYEFMAVSGSESPWFDVPSNTAFVTLQSLVAHRGILIFEPAPRLAPPRPDGPLVGPGVPRLKSPAGQ